MKHSCNAPIGIFEATNRYNGIYREDHSGHESKPKTRPTKSLRNHQGYSAITAPLCDIVSTCQSVKRPEIDRRLAAGEPVAQVARDYDLTVSSLHRHRTNCLKLGSSNQIKKDAARGSAAVALLPSKETLSDHYLELRTRIDQVVEQAQQQGSLNVAISGLNSIRQTLDSLARLAGHLQPASTQVNVAVQTNVNVGAKQIAERLIQQFDHEPELKARIAQALLEVDR